MGRTVSLRGAAAAAFMGAKMGKRAETDEDRISRILALLELELKSGTKDGRARAALIVASVAADGLEKTADALTEKRTMPAPEEKVPA